MRKTLSMLAFCFCLCICNAQDNKKTLTIEKTFVNIKFLLFGSQEYTPEADRAYEKVFSNLQFSYILTKHGEYVKITSLKDKKYTVMTVSDADELIFLDPRSKVKEEVWKDQIKRQLERLQVLGFKNPSEYVIYDTKKRKLRDPFDGE